MSLDNCCGLLPPGNMAEIHLYYDITNLVMYVNSGIYMCYT